MPFSTHSGKGVPVRVGITCDSDHFHDSKGCKIYLSFYKVAREASFSVISPALAR